MAFLGMKSDSERYEEIRQETLREMEQERVTFILDAVENGFTHQQAEFMSKVSFASRTSTPLLLQPSFPHNTIYGAEMSQIFNRSM